MLPMPTASKATSTPRPSVSSRILAPTSSVGHDDVGRAHRRARASRVGLRSTATIRSQPAARRTDMTRRPMTPGADDEDGARHRRPGARETACGGDGERLREGRLDHRHPGRQPMDRIRAGTTTRSANAPSRRYSPIDDAEHLPSIAQVDLAPQAERALAAADRAVERDRVARRQAGDGRTDGLDHAGRLVAHDQRRDPATRAPVHAVDVAAADPDRLDPDEDVLVRRPRLRDVDVLEPPGSR